jgi:lipopolysaccharide/colanic/teichoic acid biosynthesis glycosyltransferase
MRISIIAGRLMLRCSGSPGEHTQATSQEVKNMTSAGEEDSITAVCIDSLGSPRASTAYLRQGTYVRIWKPFLDRLFSVFLIIVAAPIMALIALLVRASLGPNVIFCQQRVGIHGDSFDVLKFRTMLPDRRKANVPISFPDRRCTHKSGADPRHTTMGRFLRRWSLDELPQLFNVARGQMSLVGPRPELPSVVARYQPWQHERHDVKPGLTGLWQVKARGEGPMELRTDLDVEYARSICFTLDVRIVMATVTAFFGKPGE